MIPKGVVVMSKKQSKVLVDGKRNVTGRKIRELRLERGITQTQLANILVDQYGVRIDQKVISKIEIGDRQITDIELISFAKALDVSIDELYR